MTAFIFFGRRGITSAWCVRRKGCACRRRRRMYFMKGCGGWWKWTKSGCRGRRAQHYISDPGGPRGHGLRQAAGECDGIEGRAGTRARAGGFWCGDGGRDPADKGDWDRRHSLSVSYSCGGVALWAGRDQPRGRSILQAEASRSGMTGMIQVRAWPFIFDRYSLSKK